MAHQASLPGTPKGLEEGIRRKEMLDSLFDGLRHALAPTVLGLPANGETKVTITKLVQGDIITVTYKPGE